MLRYFKKFLLDILPSVVATIVGAYIVHHYVIPAATPGNTAAAVAAPELRPDFGKSDATAIDKASFAKGVAEKAAIEKTAEKAADKTGESAPAESRKRHAAPRSAGRLPATAPDQTSSIPESPVSEERRDANDLARAALERQRAMGEPPRIATAPAQAAIPPLPPAVTLASPEIFNAGTGAIRAAQTPVPTRSADASRPMPPSEIPAAPPIDLHGDIVTTGRTTTVADDVMSAAKSVFHAVLPR